MNCLILLYLLQEGSRHRIVEGQLGVGENPHLVLSGVCSYPIFLCSPLFSPYRFHYLCHLHFHRVITDLVRVFLFLPLIVRIASYPLTSSLCIQPHDFHRVLVLSLSSLFLFHCSEGMDDTRSKGPMHPHRSFFSSRTASFGSMLWSETRPNSHRTSQCHHRRHRPVRERERADPQ